MKKREKKSEVKNQPPSPRKKKLIRVVAESGIFLLGALVILFIKTVFDAAMNKKEAAGVAVDLIKDEFDLFFTISLAVCAVLLILTMLSALTYLFQKSVSRFQRLTVSMAPIICSAAVLAISLFYAYLTSGSLVSITGYMILLGLGEAMLFRLPCAVYVLLRPLEKGKKSN